MKVLKLSREQMKTFCYRPDIYKKALPCFLTLLVFLYATYRLGEVGQPILFSDEFGYWSSSSFFLGIDWQSVTSRIPYYSYGYGLLLVPLRIFGMLFEWDWRTLYESAVVLNGCMLAGGFLLARSIAKRFFPQLHWALRDLVCFVACIYPSNIVYSHITWTENTLMFFFWVFLYFLMRCIDKPSVKNHIGVAVTAFYLYVVHQRALSILLTSICMIALLSLLRINRWKHTTAFLGSVYILNLTHSMIKGKLQNDFYLGNAPADWNTTLGYAFTIKSAILLAGILFVLLILYLYEKKHVKLAIGIVITAFVVGVVLLGMGVLHKNGSGADAANRLATNDFSGQWYKIKGIFSIEGFLRLCISMIGKWFYLTAATGFVICWGLKDCIKNAFLMLVNSIRKKQRNYLYDKKNIWLLGVFVAWFTTFMVCAIYKEGLYKVDDLVNGRYNEYVIGILIVYGFVALLKDKNWIRTLLITVVLYSLAGILCQYTLNELGRTDFELCHSVMFGRVFWNWQVPVGKVKELTGYIMPLGLAFILMVKLFSFRFPKITVIRGIVALLIPIMAWSYLTGAVLENYVISRNEKQSKSMPTIAMWVDLLEEDNQVYYLEDTHNFRWAEGIQFMMQDKPLILTKTTEVSFEEDAFFIMHRNFVENDAIKENCEIVVEMGEFALAINKNQEVMKRFENYRTD